MISSSYDLADDRESLSLIDKVTGDDVIIKNEVSFVHSFSKFILGTCKLQISSRVKSGIKVFIRIEYRIESVSTS